MAGVFFRFWQKVSNYTLVIKPPPPPPYYLRLHCPIRFLEFLFWRKFDKLFGFQIDCFDIRQMHFQFCLRHCGESKLVVLGTLLSKLAVAVVDV